MRQNSATRPDLDTLFVGPGGSGKTGSVRDPSPGPVHPPGGVNPSQDPGPGASKPRVPGRAEKCTFQFSTQEGPPGGVPEGVWRASGAVIRSGWKGAKCASSGGAGDRFRSNTYPSGGVGVGGYLTGCHPVLGGWHPSSSLGHLIPPPRPPKVPPNWPQFGGTFGVVLGAFLGVIFRENRARFPEKGINEYN
jgi:hypothetical protein